MDFFRTKKYRICTHNDGYIVEYKWLWWWTPVLEEHIDIHGHMSYFLKTFNTVQMAESYIFDLHSSSKSKVIKEITINI